MCLLFSIRYSSRSEGVVCYQSNHEWLKTKTVWYFIQYVTLKYNHIEYHSFKYWCVFLFYFTVLCLTIKSHQSHQTRSATWRVLISCKYYFYFISCNNLQYMYMHNVSRLSLEHETFLLKIWFRWNTITHSIKASKFDCVYSFIYILQLFIMYYNKITPIISDTFNKLQNLYHL